MKSIIAPAVLLGTTSLALRLVQNANRKIQVKDNNSQIAKVVELLQEIVGKTKVDETEDKAITQKNNVWCSAALAETSTNIEHEKELLNAAQGQVYSAEGKISAAQGAIDSARVSATSAQKELKDANDIRTDDAARFKEEETILLQSLSELESATRVIRAAHNQNSLLSTGAKKSMMQVVSSLDAVASSIGIEFEDHAKLAALVQASDEDDVDDDFSPVRGKEVAYESHSGDLVELLGDLTDKTETELSSLRDSETKARHAHEMMAQTLKQKIESFQGEGADQKLQLSEAQQDLGLSQKAVAQSTSTIDELQPYFKQTTSFCGQVDPKFMKNQERRGVALRALTGAIDILASKPMVDAVGGAETAYALIQKQPAGEKAVRMLEAAARRLGSVGLEQIASRVSTNAEAGTFDKVIKMIEDMVGRLQEKATSEATHKAWCDAELGKASKKKELKERKSNSYTTRKERAEAAIEQGNIEIQQARSAHGQATTELQTLIDNRNSETELWNEFKSNSEDAMARLEQAISFVAEAYPSEESLVQEPGLAPMPQEFVHKEYFDSAAGPAEILSTIRNDIEAEFVQRSSEETENKKAFQEKQTMLKVEIAKQEETGNQVEKSVARTQKSLSDVKSDLEQVTTELESLTKQLEILNGDCTHTAEPFEERAAKREDEIVSLRDALAVLRDETSGQ